MNDLFKLSSIILLLVYIIYQLLLLIIYLTKGLYTTKNIYLSLNTHKLVLNKLGINFQIYL